MFAGEHINVTEDRAVLHTALRLPEPTPTLEVDGQDVVADVHEVLRRVYAFAERVRSGAWTGVTGERIRTVVNIGIGGSDLGPVMAYEALRALPSRTGSSAGSSATSTRPTPPPRWPGSTRRRTLFIVSSKTFGTLETLTNARLCRAWLLDGLRGRGRRQDADGRAALRRGLDRAGQGRRLRHRPGQRLRLLGLGRRPLLRWTRRSAPRSSSRSARSGSPSCSPACTRWTSTSGPPSRPRNVPLLMGLLNVWYTNFLGAQTHAVLPYSQLLHRFPAYLQQLTMESNGKGVRWDGTAGDHRHRRGVLGRARHQRAARLLPADPPGHPADPGRLHRLRQPGVPAGTRDGQSVDVHELFLANFFAQTRALAFGKTADEVRAEGTAEERRRRRGCSPATGPPPRSWRRS